MKNIVLVGIFLMSLAPIANALESTTDTVLIYSGFAFSGDFSNRDQLYRYSVEISKEDEKEYLDKILTGKLIARPELRKKVSFDLSDDSLDLSSVAFALVHENVEKQIIDNQYWIVVTIQANVLAFNKKSGSVVASYPVRMRYTSVQAKEPTEIELKEKVRDVYTTEDPNNNIFDQWLNRFETVKIKEGAIKRLRVTNVEVTPESEKVIVAAGKTVPSIRNQTANFLEAAVADKSGIPVVPNSVGEAIGRNIALRFSNGREQMLTLPDPDYALSFVIRDFVSKIVEKPEYFQNIYRVKARIILTQPESERTYLDENIYDTLIVTCPKVDGKPCVILVDWDQYYKTLQVLINKLGKQMQSVDDTWLKENASRENKAKAGFLSANKLIQELI